MKPREWTFTLAVDPATIGSAGGATKGLLTMSMLARSESFKASAWLPPAGMGVELAIRLRFAVPKTRLVRPAKDWESPQEGEPCGAVWSGDCAGKAKAVVAALTRAKFWPDERYVSRIEVEKMWTRGRGRIEVCVRPHGGGEAIRT